MLGPAARPIRRAVAVDGELPRHRFTQSPSSSAAPLLAGADDAARVRNRLTRAAPACYQPSK